MILKNDIKTDTINLKVDENNEKKESGGFMSGLFNKTNPTLSTECI